MSENKIALGFSFAVLLVVIVWAWPRDTTPAAHAYLRMRFPGAVVRDLQCERFNASGDYLACEATVNGAPVALECPRAFSCNSACRMRALRSTP